MPYEEVTCPECDGPMASRRNGSTGQYFWGCKKYPACKGTRNTDGEVVTRRSVRDAPEVDASEMPSGRLRDNDRQRWRQ